MEDIRVMLVIVCITLLLKVRTGDRSNQIRTYMVQTMSQAPVQNFVNVHAIMNN